MEKLSRVAPKTPGGFAGGLVVKNLPANAEGTSVIPGSGRSLEVGNGNPLQYSCLENSMDRQAWWATVHVVTRSDTTEHAHTGVHNYTVIEHIACRKD